MKWMRCVTSDGREISMKDMLENTGSLGVMHDTYADGMMNFLANNQLKGSV